VEDALLEALEEEASLELELCSEKEAGVVEEDSSFEESAEEALELEEGAGSPPQASKRRESELRVSRAFLFIASILSAQRKQNDTQLRAPFA